MPNITCPQQIGCPGTDSPFQNWSSEQPDRLFHIGVNWGWDRNVPPLGSDWTHSTCIGTCISEISQEDADLCAAALELQCLSDCNSGDPACGDGGGGPIGGRDPNSITFPVYYNRSQICQVECEDGTLFNYILPAGSINAQSQIEADRIAASIACQRANTRKVCPSAPLGTEFDVCSGETSAGEDFFEVTGPGAPFTITVSAGMLPPDITFQQTSNRTAALFGTFTTPGNYSFTVQAVSSTGSITHKNYTVEVFGITNPSLPNGTVGVAYNQQLLTAGGELPVTFNLIGTLPGGLLLDSATGVISGVPTTQGAEGFEVEIIDTDGSHCTQVVSITVAAALAFKICNWPSVLAALTPSGGCVASALPPWDGVFDLHDACLGDPVWYFQGKSLFGSEVALDTGTPNWQCLGIGTELFFVSGHWDLWIVCTGGGASDIWFGKNFKNDPLDPSGTYEIDLPGPSSSIPINIDIAPVSGACCANWLDLLWGVPTVVNGTFVQSGVKSEFFDLTLNAGVSQAVNTATLSYKGSGCNCNLRLLITGSNLPGPLCSVSVRYLAPSTSLLCVQNVGPGIVNAAFTLPDTLGLTRTIEVTVHPGDSSGPMSLSGVFSNA